MLVYMHVCMVQEVDANQILTPLFPAQLSSYLMTSSYEHAQLPQRGNIRRKVPQLILTGFPWLPERSSLSAVVGTAAEINFSHMPQCLFLTVISWIAKTCCLVFWKPGRSGMQKKKWIQHKLLCLFEVWGWKLTAFSLRDLASPSEAKCLPLLITLVQLTHSHEIFQILYTSAEKDQISLGIYWQVGFFGNKSGNEKFLEWD